MNEKEFLGVLIGCIITLLTLASLIVALIIKPIIELNKSITKLNDSIDVLNGANATLEERVTKHGKEIDANRVKLIEHDHEINHLKEKLQ